MDADQPSSTENYLADREGLQGMRRATFLRLLRTVFGFRQPRLHRAILILGSWVAGVALIGFALELSRGLRVTSVFPWLGVVGLGGALVIALVRVQQQPPRRDQEFEWRAYCLLVRPVILAERPGLIDRNLATESTVGQLIPTPAITDMFRGIRPTNLWLQAAVGWGVGAVPLVASQLLFGAGRWIFILPFLCSLLSPLAWGLIRLLTYARVERAVGEKS